MPHLARVTNRTCTQIIPTEQSGNVPRLMNTRFSELPSGKLKKHLVNNCLECDRTVVIAILSAFSVLTFSVKPNYPASYRTNTTPDHTKRLVRRRGVFSNRPVGQPAFSLLGGRKL